MWDPRKGIVAGLPESTFQYYFLVLGFCWECPRKAFWEASQKNDVQ